jgi:ribose 5-phosphate isomerase B
MRKIAIGCDHGGFNLKKTVYDHLIKQGMDVIDLGTNSSESCNYPDFAKLVAKEVVSGKVQCGILICGTGIGISIAANKIKGIRAACCSDTFSAKMCRAHNDANILCFGERIVGAGLALELVDAFLNTKFEGGRHKTRVDLIGKIEQEEV